MVERNIKFVIHYDGTAYSGWQIQPGLGTIQGQIQYALSKLTKQSVLITGSSRTDAGVHALGQVANIKIDSHVPTENFARALNNLLPDDIVIANACEVGDDFDAIGSTVSKRYRYTICTAPVRPVLDIRHCWHRPGTLNTEAMQNAAALLVGQKDFKSFASAGDQRQSSVRTILTCKVTCENPWIYVDVQADGFLYNMVRNIVGTLVEVGRGRWQPEEIDGILAAKDRAAAGPIAPASGLCLMEIFY
jgi:tRNA pseudouridine38-40 synthase